VLTITTNGGRFIDPDGFRSYKLALGFDRIAVLPEPMSGSSEPRLPSSVTFAVSSSTPALA